MLAPMIRPEDQRLLQPCLLPGERLLWAGRPGRRLVADAGDLLLVPFGLALEAFAVWNFVRGEEADAAHIAMGLLLAALGFCSVFGRFLHDAWLRAGILYAVSDRRVIVLETRRRRRWVSFEIGALPTLVLDRHGDGRGTLHFEVREESSPYFPNDHSPWLPSGRVSFERIGRAEVVHDLIAGEAGRRRREPRPAADPLFLG